MGNWIRNVILLGLIAGAFSGLAMADYYLRHEETGKTRRWLAGRHIEINAASVIQAVSANERSVLDALEQVGIDLGEPGSAGETPLITAVRSNNSDAVDYLLGKASVIRTLDHASSREGRTALLCAMTAGDLALAEKLIKAGATMSNAWEEGVPLMIAAVKNEDAKLFDFLVKQGVSVMDQDGEGRTPLVLAVEQNKNDWAARLLEAGADVNQVGITGEALLMEAFRVGRKDLAKTLIDHGAKVDEKNNAGESALMLMIGKGDREAISTLLDAGALITGVDAQGRSIPDRLIETGDANLIEFYAGKKGDGLTDDWMNKVFETGKKALLESLLGKGGNVEAESGKEGRLLKRAVLRKDIVMVELLLKNGADPRGEVWDALASGDRSILETLLSGGADANEALVVGVGSPLSLALRQRRYDSAAILLQYGADPNPWQMDGRSLIEEAKGRGDEDAVSILRDYCSEDQ